MRTTVMVAGVLLFITSTAYAQLGIPEIKYGEELTARFVPNTPRDATGIPYEIYWFAGAIGQHVTAQVSSETFHPAISVFRASDGRHVATAHGTRTATLFTRIPADDLYFVTVTSLSRINTGFYTLSLGAQAAREKNVLFRWEFPVSRPFTARETAKCLLRYNSVAVVIGAKSRTSACEYWGATSYGAPIRVQAEMRIGSPDAKAGLILDRKSDGDKILVQIDPLNRKYTVFQKTGTAWKTLVPATWSSAIKNGDWNVLDAEIRAYSLRLSINRQHVNEIRLASPVDGKIGLWNNGATSSGESTVEFRELLVERID